MTKFKRKISALVIITLSLAGCQTSGISTCINNVCDVHGVEKPSEKINSAGAVLLGAMMIGGMFYIIDKCSKPGKCPNK